MRWERLLFIHWPVPQEWLRPLVPAGLELETYDGRAWLGVVPFSMTGVRPRFMPAVPGLSAAPELNVRTYVTAGGKPGVWFFSLDLCHYLGVWGARATYFLPYYYARMQARREGDATRYESRRRHHGAPHATFRARYWSTGPVAAAELGSLDDWLTSRYCLYAADARGRLYRAEINHPTWPLQPAAIEIAENTMTEQLGFAPPREPPLLHYAEQLDVIAWWRMPL
jgi:uncharacterized protein YqjF (DUF2071 family)